MKNKIEMIMNQLRQELDAEMQELSAKCSELPKGELKVYESKGREFWYWYEKETRHYVNKKEIETVRQMAASTFYELQKKELNEKIRCVDGCISQLKNVACYSDTYFNSSGTISKLLSDDSNTDKWAAWASQVYAHCELYPDASVYLTNKGDLVRSKSEIMIANAFWEAGIPYRYEPAYEMDGETFYPDFMTVDKIRKRFVMVEYLGLMGDDVYEAKNKKKIKMYMDHGWMPGKNLIILSEFPGRPFDVQWVWNSIRHYYT